MVYRPPNKFQPSSEEDDKNIITPPDEDSSSSSTDKLPGEGGQDTELLPAIISRLGDSSPYRNLKQTAI